jgi:hypothetical protein
MTIFTAKVQRGKEAEGTLYFVSLHLCRFAVKNFTITLITTKSKSFAFLRVFVSSWLSCFYDWKIVTPRSRYFCRSSGLVPVPIAMRTPVPAS